ncbi:MAG: GNAT family N-acetyltransferase [Alphaproteobacteria bacterium]
MTDQSEILLLRDGEEPPWPLLLDADPSRELVERYLAKGETYVLNWDRKIIGVIVLYPLGGTAWEIKNIAVAEGYQGQGFGKKLLAFAIQTARAKGAKTLRIGTGNSSFDQLALYQKAGFRIIGIDRGFFTRHPYEPMEENGIAVTDMVMLEMAL